MTRSLDALRQAVEGLAAVQDQVKREMTSCRQPTRKFLPRSKRFHGHPPLPPHATPHRCCRRAGCHSRQQLLVRRTRSGQVVAYRVSPFLEIYRRLRRPFR